MELVWYAAKREVKDQELTHVAKTWSCREGLPINRLSFSLGLHSICLQLLGFKMKPNTSKSLLNRVADLLVNKGLKECLAGFLDWKPVWPLKITPYCRSSLNVDTRKKLVLLFTVVCPCKSLINQGCTMLTSVCKTSLRMPPVSPYLGKHGIKRNCRIGLVKWSPFDQ